MFSFGSAPHEEAMAVAAGGDSPPKPPRQRSFDDGSPTKPVRGLSADSMDPFSSNGIFTRLGENIPLVSSGIQLMHELAGNERALQRARDKDPVGPNGYITQAIEHVPVFNSVVQQVHEAGGEGKALERAKDRDPIGTHGYLTKVFEHIPIVSDGVMAIHRYHGDDAAAERARGYSLEKLFSKDGAITRVAELLPVSNLLAAAAHEMNGDADRARRALDLFASWAQVSQPDGPLFQVAELFPGADAVAFAVHLQGGHYAQALRSVTKTSWVNVETDEVVLFLSFRRLSQLWLDQVEFAQVDVIPRQLSLVVGMSDLLTNFLRVDREGHRRAFRLDQEKPMDGRTVMDLTKELIKRIVDDKLNGRISYFTEEMPSYLDWMVELMNQYLPKYQKESLAWRLCSPKVLPPLTEEAHQECQRAFPNLLVEAGPLEAPEPIRLKPRRRPPEGTTAVSCWACAGAFGLGTKVGAFACAAGIVAGAVEFSRAAVRHMVTAVSDRNARRWHAAIIEPQPASESTPPGAPCCSASNASSSGSNSPASSRTAPGAGDVAAAAGEASARSNGRTAESVSSASGDAARHERSFLTSGAPSASSSSSTSPSSPSDPALIRHPEQACDPNAVDLPADVVPGVVLEIAERDLSRLDPFMRSYLLQAVFPSQGSVSSLRGCLGALGRSWMLRKLREVLKAPQVPLVLDVDLDGWEVELDYSFNLKLPSMRFALVFHVDLMQRGRSTRIVRAFAALPEELLSNVLQSFREQLLGWDLRELDPRFAGFTQPAHVAFDLDVCLSSANSLRLVARGVKSRLDLPAS